MSVGWTYVQDTADLIVSTVCAAGNTTCTITVPPTAAGSVWTLFSATGNTTATTISSVTGGGGTWVHCPSCEVHNSSGANDASYNLGGTTGSTSFTATISQAASSFWVLNFIEVLPPPGATASFDTSGTSSSTSCTSCSGVALTTTATDAIIQNNHNGGTPGGWNDFTSPYIATTNNNAIYLNSAVGSITAPTFTQAAGGSLFSAMAFKSSLGTFTPDAQPFSLLNFVQASPTCNPTCNITVPSTGAGNLLFIYAGTTVAAHSVISSVSGGGTWIVPTGAGKCPITITASNPTLSCAYVASSSSGTTTVTVTMSANAATGFGYFEVPYTGGTLLVDAQGTAQRAANTTGKVNGVDLSLTGNDVIFQATYEPGGAGFVTLYPQPFINGNGISLINSDGASAVIRMNTTDGTHPIWVTNQSNQANSVSAVAFTLGIPLDQSMAPNDIPSSGIFLQPYITGTF